MIFIEWPKFIKQINKYDPLNISIEINSLKAGKKLFILIIQLGISQL